MVRGIVGGKGEPNRKGKRFSATPEEGGEPSSSHGEGNAGKFGSAVYSCRQLHLPVSQASREAALPIRRFDF